jgi:hypothetical protein
MFPSCLSPPLAHGVLDLAAYLPGSVQICAQLSYRRIRFGIEQLQQIVWLQSLVMTVTLPASG